MEYILTRFDDFDEVCVLISKIDFYYMDSSHVIDGILDIDPLFMMRDLIGLSIRNSESLCQSNQINELKYFNVFNNII